MKKKDETVYFDSEEKDLLDSYDNDEWVSTLTQEKKRYYEDVAKYSMGKNKRINIRITEKDFHDIQAQGLKNGVPYQTLIAMLIHKYNQGKLTL